MWTWNISAVKNYPVYLSKVWTGAHAIAGYRGHLSAKKSAILEIGKAMGMMKVSWLFLLKIWPAFDVQVDWPSQIAELGFALNRSKGKTNLFI